MRLSGGTDAWVRYGSCVRRSAGKNLAVTAKASGHPTAATSVLSTPLPTPPLADGYVLEYRNAKNPDHPDPPEI